MEDIDHTKEPANEPILRINLKDADIRTGPKDRRKVHTYIANDRRSGLADRRKNQNKNIIPNKLVMESIDYKGHKIRATPHQLAKSNRWALEFQIFSPNGHNILAKVFSAVNTFETGKEAALHCLNLGKQIIDSKPNQ